MYILYPVTANIFAGINIRTFEASTCSPEFNFAAK